MKLMGDAPWSGIFIPDVGLSDFADASEAAREAQINKLIGSQNDPIVRHRLSFFYERIKSLEAKFGVPVKIVLDLCATIFIGKKAKSDLTRQSKRASMRRKSCRRS